MIAGSAADPAPLVAHLLQHEPVCWLPGLDAWLVMRHEDVRRSFSDARLTADVRFYERYKPPSDLRAARWLAQMPFRASTAEDLSPGRRLVSAALTPRVVALLEPLVREVVDGFAAPLRARTDRVDLMSEFAIPVAATAIGRVLGVPAKGEDAERFRQLAVQATATIRPFLSDAKQQRSEQAAGEMCDYILGLVEERITDPGDDLISRLLIASERDAAPEQIAAVVAGLVSAGTGTTSLAFGRTIRTLLRHPEALAALRRDRALLPNGVEELLRYDNGILAMPRYVVEEMELRGKVFRKGQLVLLGVIGANRDPRVFPDPEQIDLRRDVREAVSFGFGSHYCIGSNLARVELRLMIDAALDFLPPGARLREEEIRWSKKGLMSQIKTLPVDFGPPSR
jgi:cytochrome P450